MKQESGYRYDVFVSYNAADRDWVATVLLPRLEQATLRVAIDYHDFIVGKLLIENIEDTVGVSRRTIVVLSPEWVASEWNAFEALISRSEDPAALRRTVLPVLLRPCDVPDWLTRPKRDIADLTAERYREANLKRVVRDIMDAVPVSLPRFGRDWARWRRWLRWYRWQVRRGLGVLLLLWLILSLTFQWWPFQRRLSWQIVGQTEARLAKQLFRVENVLLTASYSTPSDCNGRDTGLARSTDNGRSWQPVAGEPLLIESAAGQCLRADVSDFATAAGSGRTIVYAATTAGRFRNAVGLLRSTDLGLTWAALAAPALRDANLTSIVALDNAPDHLLVATENAGLLRTRDAGTTWQRLDETCAGHPERRLPTSTRVHTLLTWGAAVYVGTDQGLYVSADDGDCWTQLGSGEGQRYGYNALQGIPGHPDQLLALIYDYATTSGANHFLWLVERDRGRVGAPLWSSRWTTPALYLDFQTPLTWYVASDFGPVARGSLNAVGRWEDLPTIRRCSLLAWLISSPCLADLAPDATPSPPLLLAGNRIYRYAEGPWWRYYWP